MTATHAKPRLIADGKYELLEIIGEGGMGLVYVGRHVVLDRKIAVKVLHPEFVHRADATDRFLKEARLVSQLRHQNTVQLLDFGTDGREYWLVMEYLDGKDLATLIADNGKLAPLRALQIAIQLLAALGEAHDTGIIHCDLKPANIMVIPWHDDDGMASELVKVLDFGIATMAVDSRPTKEIAGTPDYMSPEQALGQGVEARSDLYAVGVMLHEMLTGESPFLKDDAVQTMWAQVEEPPPLLRSLEPTLPETLEACLQTALAKDRDDRFPQARVFRAQLIEIAEQISGITRLPATRDGEVVGAGAETDKPAVAAARPRSKGMWFVVAVALLASGAAFILTLTSSGGPPPPSAPTRVARTADLPARPAVMPELAVIAVVDPITLDATAAEVVADAVDTNVADDARVTEAEREVADDEIAANEANEVDAPPIAVASSATPPPEDRSADADHQPAAEAKTPAPAVSARDRAEARKQASRERDEEAAAKEAKALEPTTPTPPPAEPVAAKVIPPEPEPAAASPSPQKPAPPKEVPVREPAPVAKVIPTLSATAAFTDLAVQGSLPRSSVQRVLDGAQNAVTGCYREGAVSAGKDLPGNLTISFEVNIDGQMKNVVVQSFALPGVSACVQANLGRLRTRDRPDTGTVSATARLRFNPLPPR